MSPELISLLGIIVGVAVFIFMAFKGFQLVITASVASLVIIFTSGMPFMEMLGTWTGGLSRFINNYFLALTLSAVIGKLMNDSGAAKRIARSLYAVSRCQVCLPNWNCVSSVSVCGLAWQTPKRRGSG